MTFNQITPVRPARSGRRFLLAMGFGLLLLAVLPFKAGAQAAPVVFSFTNNTPIIISNGYADGFPYPSTNQVPALPGTLQSVTVTLFGLSDVQSVSIELLLIGPTGQGVDLMSDAGNGLVTNAIVTIADAGGPFPGGTIGSGTYQPSGVEFPIYSPFYGLDTTNQLAGFIGTTLAGAWSLYEYYVDYQPDANALTNGFISGGWSLNFTLLPAAPAVTNLAAAPVTANSATLNANVNPGGAATTVYFQYGLTAAYGSFSGTNVLSSDVIDTQEVSLPVTGLLPGFTYHFQAIAQNAAGTNLAGDLTFTLLPDPPAVTNLAAAPVTANSATLNANVNPGGAATTVYFQYGLTTAYGSFSGTNVLSSDVIDTQEVSLPVTGLLPGATYHFQAIAQNAAGTNLAGDSTFVTPAVVTAPGLQVTITNGTELVLIVQGVPGSNYVILVTTNLAPPITWTTVTNLTLTSAVEYINLGPLPSQPEYFSLEEAPAFQPPGLTVTITNGTELVLIVQGVPGSNYVILVTTNLAPPITWKTVTNLTLTSAVEYINLGPLPNRPEYFILEAAPAYQAPPALALSLLSGSNPVLTLSGNTGSQYSIQSAASLSPPVNWSTFTNLTLANAVQSISLGPATNGMQFFRAVQP